MPIQIENLTLYNVEEVGQVVNSHPNTVRDHCNKGIIKAQKVNGAWYVTRNNLEDLVEELDFPKEIINYRLGITPVKPNTPKANLAQPGQ